MTENHTHGNLETLIFPNHELQTDFAMLKIGNQVHMVGSSEENKANARRLAACWNALDGISTTEIETAARCGSISHALAKVIKQRDELLDVLKGFHMWAENQSDAQSKGGHATFDLWMLREQRDLAATAIAKATGEPT